MATAAKKTRITAAEQARRSAQSDQDSISTAAAERADLLAAAERAASVVNLDEVTLETIQLGYVHWTEVQVEQPDGRSTKKWQGEPRHIDLYKDIDSALLFELMQYQDAFRAAEGGGIDPEALKGIREIVWKAWQFTDPDVPLVDVQRLPLLKLVTLASAFFTPGNR